jgi:hypothetical protein
MLLLIVLMALQTFVWPWPLFQFLNLSYPGLVGLHEHKKKIEGGGGGVV